ncbi:hypothetical protein JY651_31660 [Pyxidicoccus parkwayensis]|uniref:Lipoprotein n=1 Tax=Pyxidicoccus parkwayensis TaxID=2813578 RepID=A0ABX7NLV2_9BACT|nr:hypothetical protein [Pyxidicoccus parkwaysis]QSQ19827.1 hypothetical protein JY651_31660 [Pyxidicoccus parkwaysis]
MNIVKSVVLAAFAAGAVACGGDVEFDENTRAPADGQLATSEQGICEGYSAGAVCTIKCTSSSPWFFIGGVSFGQCTAAGTSACGYTPYGTCWSTNP